MTGVEVHDIVKVSIIDALRRTDEVELCDDTAELFAVYCADSNAGRVAHLERIEAEAYRLGREVGSYNVTMADARARIERLLDVRVDDCPVPLRRVPLPVGRVAARSAFDAGMVEAQRRAAS